MDKYQDLLAAARSIRPELNDLLGNRSEETGRALDDLLRLADTGVDVEIELLDLLSDHYVTREWMRNELKSEVVFRGERAFTPLPGDIDPPEAIVYVCEEVGCDTQILLPKVLTIPPSCSICGRPMKRKV